MTTEFLLAGLPGDNPLGYMAALGALVTAHDAWPRREERGEVRLAWRLALGGWRPVLRVPGMLGPEALTDLLHRALHKSVDPAAQDVASKALAKRNACSSEFKGAQKRLKALGRRATREARAQLVAEEIEPAREALRNAAAAYRAALAAGGAPDPAVSLGAALKQVSGEAFAEAATQWAISAGPANRRCVDLAASFGSEAVLDDEDNLNPTQFSKHNGAGGRSMLADIGRLMVQVEPGRIAAALFTPWDYEDEKYGLGWDPADARAHALMAENPERAGSVTMHGANLLAFEALQFFPAVAIGRRLATTGTDRIADLRQFTWVVWTPALGADAVRTLVALDGIQEAAPDRASLERLGITEVYRAEHFTFGKYPRFRPARSV